MTDRLDAIEADLERPEVLNTENGCSVANVGSGDVRWLVGEVRRLRGGIKAWEDKEVHEAMACWKDNEQLKADLTALRESHAAAVAVATEAIAACRCDTLHHKKSERHSAFERCPVMARLDAWLASEAKARLT